MGRIQGHSLLQRQKCGFKVQKSNNFNKRFSEIRNAFQKLNLNAVIDGEVVCLTPDGKANFNELISGTQNGTLVFYAFDILWFNGYNLQGSPLIASKDSKIHTAKIRFD